jgi:hypothetical protein
MEHVTQKQVLEELQGLEPNRWFEVLDFIGFLKERAHPGPQKLTARTLRQSEIVGIWADREDIGSSLDFARWLRQEAERRRGLSDDSC